VTREEAIKWLLQGEREVFDETFVEGIPEAGDEPGGATLYVRVPPTLKRRIDAAIAADSNKPSVNAWALRAFERVLEPPEIAMEEHRNPATAEKRRLDPD